MEVVGSEVGLEVEMEVRLKVELEGGLEVGLEIRWSTAAKLSSKECIHYCLRVRVKRGGARW